MTQTFADRVEKLKSDYTDKYVVADSARLELRRFQGLTGQVKTVNMSGRALVEFEGHNNIGWYDIELDYLKVVDKPEPKPAAKGKAAPAKKKPAAKPTAEKGLSPLELARMQGPAKKGSDAGDGASDRKSKTAGILAAARVKKGSAAGAAAAPGKPAGKLNTADILAAARGGAAAAPAAKPKPESAQPAPKKTDSKEMSTADILAAARGKAAAKPREEAPAAAPAEETAETAAEAKPAAAAAATGTGELPTETADIIAWCRETDAS